MTTPGTVIAIGFAILVAGTPFNPDSAMSAGITMISAGLIMREGAPHDEAHEPDTSSANRTDPEPTLSLTTAMMVAGMTALLGYWVTGWTIGLPAGGALTITGGTFHAVTRRGGILDELFRGRDPETGDLLSREQVEDLVEAKMMSWFRSPTISTPTTVSVVGGASLLAAWFYK